jgi:hypothetical protein
LITKDAAYGSAIDEFGIEGIAMHAYEKASRIKHRYDRGTLEEPKCYDDFKDLAGYAILGMMRLKKAKP